MARKPYSRRTQDQIDEDSFLPAPPKGVPNTSYRAGLMLPKSHPRVKGAVGNAMLVPILHLAVPNRDRLDAYRKGVRTPASCIASLKDVASPGPIHAALTDLLGPKVSRTNLYVGDDGRPLYRVTIHRGDDGLWRLRRPQVIGVTRTPRDGVFVDMPRLDPASCLPDDRLPKLVRVWGGGEDGVTNLAIALEGYEMRRMVAHAYIIARLIGGCHRRGALPLYLGAGGRLDVRVDESSGDGWLEPFAVTPVRTRLHATPPPTASVVVLGDPDGYAMSALFPRYVLPRVRPDLILDVPERDDEANGDLRRICERLFESLALPCIVVVRPPEEGEYARTQEWIVPTYDAKARRTVPKVVRRGRYVKGDGAPKLHLTPHPDYPDSLRVEPDAAMLSVLLSVLLTEGPDQDALLHRKDVVFVTLEDFGARDDATLRLLCAAHRHRLCREEVEAFMALAR